MNILMVTSELVPYAKAGGLADMVAALSAELSRLGHDVRVVVPRYYGIYTGGYERMREPLGVPVGFGEKWCSVYETRQNEEDGGARVYFLEHEGLFGRDGIYGYQDAQAFHDNMARFTLLSRGAFQLCKALEWTPHVMHAHDWPVALVPVYLRTWEKVGVFAETGSVLTIHNLGYQGIFPKDEIHLTQLSWQEFHGAGFEHHDELNLLKGGITSADILTTVSPTYAGEIQTSTDGEGLEGLLQSRESDLYGVLNGMDYREWSPRTDKHIPKPFSTDDISGKAEAKTALQRELGLEVRPEVPVIGIVSRLVEQKGFGALCGPTFGSLYQICNDLAVQVAILGTGERWCEDELRSLASKLPNLAVQVRFDNRLAHLIEAGSDFFLMPSAYEPCGLNQMYSMSYGTLPIVRRTGGLADTVDQYEQTTGQGTGFLFDDLTPGAIFDVVGWAVWTWYNRPEHIQMMRKTAMEKRFSWKDAAQRYVELYETAIEKRRNATTK
ncbi:MAG: glycogen synthase [bacterium]|nr:glycogen synthase [bacterium]